MSTAHPQTDAPATSREEKAPHRPLRRRAFKLERFPLHIQAAVFRAYGRGESYKDIAQWVTKQGYPITEPSIGRYWRKVYRDRHKKLQEAWLIKEHLKEALRGDRKSSNAAMAEELLYTMVVKKMDELEQEPPMPLLKEGREQGKVAGEAQETAAPVKSSPVQQAREIRHRWRHLYGLDQPDQPDEAQPEENVHED